MFTRREVVLGAVTAGTAALIGGPNMANAAASQPSTPVNFRRARGRLRLPRAHFRSATFSFFARAAVHAGTRFRR